MAVYSYSRIGCFETCPRKFKFQYIEKPPIEVAEGIEAFMGKMVHEVMEECYRLAAYGRPLSEGDLLSLFERKWGENLPVDVKIVRENLTADDYFRIGLKALRNYHARQYPFDQEMTLGLERNVSFALDPDGKYKMTGFIDRITRDGAGRLRIHDYKTSANLPTQPEIDADKQLALYQYAVEKMWPDNNGIELVWHYMQFDADLVSHRTPEQLEVLRKEYIDKIRRIEAATELGNFPTQESNLCNWCEYFSLCPAKGGPGVVSAAPQLPLKLSGSELAGVVDEYLALDGRKKEADKRMQELREILIEHGEAGSTTFLAGTGEGGVSVTRSQTVKLPTKSSDNEAFERIQEMIRAAGLYPEFSSLDMGEIQKALETGGLPPELTDRLQAFRQVVPQATIRVKKPK